MPLAFSSHFGLPSQGSLHGLPTCLVLPMRHQVAARQEEVESDLWRAQQGNCTRSPSSIRRVSFIFFPNSRLLLHYVPALAARTRNAAKMKDIKVPFATLVTDHV